MNDYKYYLRPDGTWQNKKYIALLAFCLSATIPVQAWAEFSPEKTYIPTLTGLYQEQKSAINSYYDLTFEEDATDYNFVFYKLNADNTTTPIYYKYLVSENPDKNGIKYTSRFYGDIAQGYFVNIYGDMSNGMGGAAIREYSGGDITADFINNSTRGYYQNGSAKGGAIYNSQQAINDIRGDFIGNYAYWTTPNPNETASANGGAIYSLAAIDNIYGNFIGNYAFAQAEDISTIWSSAITKGGAIFSENSSIGNIRGNFIGNYAHSKSGDWSSSARGGAIYMYNSSLNSIEGDFIGNYVKTERVKPTQDTADGGAIYLGYNDKEIEFIKGNFIGNYTHSYVGGKGGAIFNHSTIKKLEGMFINNANISTNDHELATNAGQGGAVHNYGNIKELSASFVSNSSGLGGAIYNEGTIELIKGDFIENKAEYGGALYLPYHSNLKEVRGNFIGNKSSRYGGAVYADLYSNNKVSSKFSGEFVQNSVESKTEGMGGAIFHQVHYSAYGSGFYYDDNGTILKTGPYWSVLIVNDATNLKLENSLFKQNSVVAKNGNAFGGAIAAKNLYSASVSFMSSWSKEEFEQMKQSHENNPNYFDSIDKTGFTKMNSIIELVNSSFYDNSVVSTGGEAKGGAIYSTANLNIIADGGSSVFKGNTANGVSNAIYMSKEKVGYYANEPDNYEYVDITDLFPATALTLSSLNGGTIDIYDGIDGDSGYKLVLKGDGSGSINLLGEVKNADIIGGDSVVNYQGLEKMSGAGKTSGMNQVNIAHADLLNHNNSLTLNSGMMNIADLGLTELRFNKLTFNGGVLNINNVGVDLASQKMGGIFADEIVTGSTVVNVEGLDVNSDNEGSTSISFTDNLIGDKVVNKVNKALGPVYEYDVKYDPSKGDYTFVKKEGAVNPEVETPSVAAVAAVSVLSDEIYSRVLADIDGLHEDRDSVVCNRDTARTWVKTFGSDDKVDLKHFAGADSKFNGIIGGIESGKINEGQGWSAVYNVYGAYAGGEQKFSSEKIVQDGGYLGATASFYKDGFFAGATLNAGTIRNKSKSVAGKDKFNSFLGGVGFKLGYNYQLSRDLILQPNLYSSYTYIKVNDYTTAKGAEVKFDNMHNFELAPGIKLAKDFGRDARGYLKGRYVFIFNEGQKATANQIEIPEIELKDYAEYGFGAEKIWRKYDLSGFAEIMRRDGGREGWAANLGVKWNFR